MAQTKKFKEETSDLEPGSVVGIIEEQYILNEYRVLPRSMQVSQLFSTVSNMNLTLLLTGLL